LWSKTPCPGIGDRPNTEARAQKPAEKARRKSPKDKRRLPQAGNRLLLFQGIFQELSWD
jgi:hypothetical protein